MGTNSTKKFLKQVSGTTTEEFALTTSAGAGDANRLPALNAAGVLDPTIVNSKTTSAGAGDSGKVAALNASGILDPTLVNSTTTSAGAGSAGKVAALDGSGRLDSTMLPVGIGADTATILASEALSAGNLVNIYNNAGTANVRKADATTQGKEAHGFVLGAVASGANATVYFEGTNTAMTGLTPGPQFLNTTAGGATSAAPSASGNVVQRLGIAVSATALNFEASDPIVLA
ncbi:hypothetical protein [Variovorax sp. RCC_210]|uniref:hypothetical protein n=1 Tax=Variovorax sp. RCC_210 TaxID=3239217 RepID=UPI0035261D0F